MRVTILGGGGFRVPLICRELAASGLAVGEVVLYDVVPERLGAISVKIVPGADHFFVGRTDRLPPLGLELLESLRTAPRT